MKRPSTCLWFDTQAETAAKFYETVFTNAKITKISRYTKAGKDVSNKTEGEVMLVSSQIENVEVLGLNGGPQFKFNPSFSFFVSCSSEQEIQDMWKKLSAGGQVRMALDKYPWSERYGWTSDQFGVEWQLTLGPAPAKIATSFLFTDALFGRGEEAVNLYTSLFPDSKIESMARDEKTKSIMHCRFSLNGQSFALMEGQGKHGQVFNNSVSIVANCESQAEIDRLWEGLLADGGHPEQCGWLKDKFGISWQIVPTILAELTANPATAEKTMAAVLKMIKLDIATLVAASR